MNSETERFDVLDLGTVPCQVLSLGVCRILQDNDEDYYLSVEYGH